MKRWYITILACALLLFPPWAHGLEPSVVEALTLPFGTSSYSSDMALESLFRELDSPVSILLKQTPGAMFITRYMVENQDKMRSGKTPFAMTSAASCHIPYMGAGLPPFEQYPTPDLRIIFKTSFFAVPFVTYDENIRSPRDFLGKKVGVAELSRPNMSTLLNKPIFDNGYGQYDKVNWQYLGFANSKDAILNGSIDVHLGNINAQVEYLEDGTIAVKQCVMDPSLMEAISSGRPYYIVSEDPGVIRTAYDPEKDQVYMPLLLRAGSLPNQTEDAWLRGAYSVYAMDKDAPDELVAEIVYQIFSNIPRLADYSESFSLMDDNPYPLGMDHKWIHPGLFLAMERLGLPLPEGVTLPQKDLAALSANP